MIKFHSCIHRDILAQKHVLVKNFFSIQCTVWRWSRSNNNWWSSSCWRPTRETTLATFQISGATCSIQLWLRWRWRSLRSLRSRRTKLWQLAWTLIWSVWWTAEAWCLPSIGPKWERGAPRRDQTSQWSQNTGTNRCLCSGMWPRRTRGYMPVLSVQMQEMRSRERMCMS